MIEAYENSEEYQAAYQDRLRELSFSHPDVDQDEEYQDYLKKVIRGSKEYIHGLHRFYKTHRLPSNPEALESFPPELKTALADYWNAIESYRKHADRIRVNYEGHHQLQNEMMLRQDMLREEKHVKAALEMLKSLPPGQEDDELINKATGYTDGEVIVGRHLVSLMTEDRGIEAADPDREEKKNAAKVANAKILLKQYQDEAK